MAISTTTVIATLEAQYTALLTQLSALPGADSVSDQGRSVSYNRTALLAQLKDIETRLAALGAPVGTIGVPFAQTSRTRS